MGIFIFMVIVGVLNFIFLEAWKVGLAETIFSVFLSAIIGFILGGAIFLGLDKIVIRVADTQDMVKDTKDLACFIDDTETTSKHYLLSSKTNENLIYKFYVKNEDGGKEYQEIKCKDNVSIYENGNCKISYISREFTNPKLQWFFYSGDVYKYKIEIPENSIVTDYKLDLK